MREYGKELILDLQNANPDVLRHYGIHSYCIRLCKLLGMERVEFHYIESEDDEEKDPQTFGISAVQFIVTSSITIHALRLTNDVFVNVFSCGAFDVAEVIAFTEKFFGATCRKSTQVSRKWS